MLLIESAAALELLEEVDEIDCIDKFICLLLFCLSVDFFTGFRALLDFLAFDGLRFMAMEPSEILDDADESLFSLPALL